MNNLMMDPALLGRKFKWYNHYSNNKEVIHTILGFYVAEAQIYCIHAGETTGIQSTNLMASGIYDFITQYEKEEQEKKLELEEKVLDPLVVEAVNKSGGTMTINCPDCKGIGYSPKEPAGRLCNRCGGTGKVK